MRKVRLRPNLPILLLHNLDPSWTDSDIAHTLLEVSKLESALREQGYDIINVPVRDAGLRAVLKDHDPDEVMVFNWCEGLPGVPHSEPLVVELLEEMRFTYTGSSRSVIALSWDKTGVKRLLRGCGISTPNWRVYKHPRANGWTSFPAIVKPAQEHCSLGVTNEAVVTNQGDLRSRIRWVMEEFQQPALVEDFIDGREFHVSLWGNGVVEMLPPAEMDFAAFEEARDRLCTYDSKFTPGSRHYDQIQLKLPAPLTEEARRQLEKTAMAAYKAIGCRDYGRVDIRLREGVFHVLDVNPNADISSDTSLVASAELAGYTYGQMLSRLVHLAALRHPIHGSLWAQAPSNLPNV
jgi:D-alanine-D-alanine ligase